MHPLALACLLAAGVVQALHPRARSLQSLRHPAHARLQAWNPLDFDLGEGLVQQTGSFMDSAALPLASTVAAATATAAAAMTVATPESSSLASVKSVIPTMEVPLWWLESIQTITSSAANKIATASEAPGTLLVLGNDMLVFLIATIAIVPLFQFLNASPVIGFLAAGLAMGPAGLGLFKDLVDLESLAEAGVLFLLFEQGLELTVERLTGLSKYAFGMGTLQVLLCTGAFFIFPFIGGVQFLETIMGSRPEIVDITRVDEAIVIGAALSLSSSAFVLKLLQEKNQLSTRFGAACLGVLLFQDIAVVPLLVLLPIIEDSSGAMDFSAQAALLIQTVAKAFLGLGGILVIGGAIVRYLFSLIAKTRSSETFVALVILTALGTGKLTDSLGLSSTLGAFTAGTLLAESNYRTQIESDIKPFRGLLLGLFFLTTGASVDPYVIKEQWTTVLALLAGLVAFKTIITTALGPLFGLTKAESVRTGLLLSGGGEFAFVVLTLADKLEVLPGSLAKVLVGVVVLSMAITPYLSELGDKAAEYLTNLERKELENVAENYDALQAGGSSSGHQDLSSSDVIVICGYGIVGEAVAEVLCSPEVVSKLSDGRLGRNIKTVAFDLDPGVVVNGYRDGKQVLYGDGSQPAVLTTSGITAPRAFVITYADPETCFKAVERLRESYPGTPIFVRYVHVSLSSLPARPPARPPVDSASHFCPRLFVSPTSLYLPFQIPFFDPSTAPPWSPQVF